MLQQENIHGLLLKTILERVSVFSLILVKQQLIYISHKQQRTKYLLELSASNKLSSQRFELSYAH